MASRRAHIRYFADENALGLAKLLLQQRDDIVHPGHRLVPEVPLGAADLDWLPLVGRMHWIVLSRDRRIRSRPAELRMYWHMESARFGSVVSATLLRRILPRSFYAMKAD